jgi:hypothetical protein
MEETFICLFKGTAALEKILQCHLKHFVSFSLGTLASASGHKSFFLKGK